MPRREALGQVGRPLLRGRAIEPHVVDLDVGRGIERAAEELLLDAQRAFEVQHVQAAFEHVDERAQLVVGGHQFARLLGGSQRELVFAGHLRNVFSSTGSVSPSAGP